MIRYQLGVAAAAALSLLLVFGMWVRGSLSASTRWLTLRLLARPVPAGSYRLLPGPAATLRRFVRAAVTVAGVVSWTVVVAFLPMELLIGLVDAPWPRLAGIVGLYLVCGTLVSVLPRRLLGSADRLTRELARLGARPTRTRAVSLAFQLIRLRGSVLAIRVGVAGFGLLVMAGMARRGLVDPDRDGTDSYFPGAMLAVIVAVVYGHLLQQSAERQDAEAVLLVTGRALRDPQPAASARSLRPAVRWPVPFWDRGSSDLQIFTTALGRVTARLARPLPEPARQDVQAGGARLAARVSRSALVDHAALRDAVGHAIRTALVHGAAGLAREPGEPTPPATHRKVEKLLNLVGVAATVAGTLVGAGVAVYSLVAPPH